MTKYRARRTIVDNIRFDSRAEAMYYAELKIRMRSGEIVEFERQPEFVLQDKFKKNGTAYRPIKYKADFLLTYADGRKEVIDVKGYKTKEYLIKKKMFEYRYPDMTIVEVSR